MAASAASTTEPLNWKKSCCWLALAVACFHAAYTSIEHPALGLFIFGYAFALVRLTDQPNVRRAFYFGLATGLLCDAPQLYFFWNIFGPGAMVLWLVVAFWVGLFTAIACGAIRRWGKARAAWLIPIFWTGLEYFRSELYYLKFSWLNVGYALQISIFGTYSCGFVIFSIITLLLFYRSVIYSLFTRKLTWREALLFLILLLILGVHFLPALAESKSRRLRSLSLVGIQMEFPSSGVIPRALDAALAKNTNAPIFVLSEYTLDGPPTDALKNWCRVHARFLVVGGKDPAGTNDYYDTAFVVGTNGDIVFKQGKAVPIQFFKDGLPAPEQKIWDSPWGKIGICICYDLSYTRVTDELVRQGAQLLIVPTMDVSDWGQHEHELHSRIAPVRAAEYGIPIFRVASSGISQAVSGGGQVVATAPMPGSGEILSAQLRLPSRGSLPLDRWLAPTCTGVAAIVMVWLLASAWKARRLT